MRKDALRVALIWVILVVVGELLVLGPSYLPDQFAEEAAVVDDAYILLAVLAVPRRLETEERRLFGRGPWCRPIGRAGRVIGRVVGVLPTASETPTRASLLHACS